MAAGHGGYVERRRSNERCAVLRSAGNAATYVPVGIKKTLRVQCPLFLLCCWRQASIRACF